MKIILSFCGSCAVLLPAGLGHEDDPHCPNCGESVKRRENRPEGEFSEEDAYMLRSTL